MVTELRVNDQIRKKKIRVVDNEGEQIGIMPVNKGRRLAEEKGLDLVEVAPQANPPVCKIMDYGKYKYRQKKKEQEAKKNQVTINVKEVKLRPKIGEHDFQVKLKAARRFLESNDKVKATVMFRGREIVHKDIGRDLLERLTEETSDLGRIESKPKMEGRNMIMVIGPKSESN